MMLSPIKSTFVLSFACAALALTGCSTSPRPANSTKRYGSRASYIYQTHPDAVPLVSAKFLKGLSKQPAGRRMMRADQLKVQRAILENYIDHDSSWSNRHTGMHYDVKPTAEYKMNGRPCRAYTITAGSSGHTEQQSGVVCKKASGQWSSAKSAQSGKG